ncbi:unnamed protein product [Symbiodinium sp. CCMP2592]|nr:unnamed protein product [Symbiodinium sp. CCMP2592]
MASSEPAAAVLGRPEALDVDARHHEAGPQEGSTPVRNPDHVERQSGAPEVDYVEELLGALPDVGLNTRFISDFLARMRVTSPDIIRAVPVQHIFRGFARPLRQHGDYYHLSQVTARIGAFWPHSWHGSMRRKIFTVFFFHKSTAATILSTTTAIFCYVAFGLAILPDDGNHSWWCLSVGSVTYALVMLVWQPQQLVFLDRVCISQTDPELQTEGLLSLGGILKNSDQMLVLWDSSWARRLWCIFELSAFLHSRPRGGKTNIRIRPTMLGFTICAAWFAFLLGGFTFHAVFYRLSVHREGFYLLLSICMACCGLGFWYIAHLGREYCRDVSTMCQQIGHFRIAMAQCYCCSSDHQIDGSDTPMICDRVIILHCIRRWFGSVEAFEEYVQNEVYDLLLDQLSNHMISYWRLAEATPVQFWVSLDRAALHLRLFFQRDSPHDLVWSLLIVINGLALWLGVIPMVFRIMFRLGWVFQGKCSWRPLDWLKSLLVLLPGSFIFGLFLVMEYLLVNFLPEPFNACAFSFISLPLAALAWKCLSVPVPHRSVRSV